MGKSISINEALGNVNDLTVPTSTQQQPLGKIIEIYDTAYKSIKKYMYVKAHTTLTQYGIYIVSYGSTAAAEIITAATVDTSATKDVRFYNIPCVAEVAFTADYYGWVCIQGMTTITSTGSTTILHAAKLGDAIATITTQGAATIDTFSVALAVVASTGSQNKQYYLIGMGREVQQYTAS